MRHVFRNSGSGLPRRMVGAAAVVGALTVTAHAEWSVVNLHPAGVTSSQAWGVYGGQQVGYATVGIWHASLWSGSAAPWVDLNPAGATRSWAVGVHGDQQVGFAVVGDPEHDRASLWTGTAASWVNLNPAGAGGSRAYGVHSGQQVGEAYVGGVRRASLWSGSAASWVDLTPAGATDSYAHGVYGGQQVGNAVVGGVRRASLWTGSAASWVDLHQFLPSHFTSSEARGIWDDGVFTYVAGHGYNATAGREEALMWVVPEPASLGLLMVGGLTLLRRRS